MDPNSVKQSIIRNYGRLAKSTRNALFPKLFACCTPEDNAQRVGEAIGYSPEELNSVPKGSNLGVGCGNPSALSNIKAGETVVDLGSGAGFDAFIVARQVGDKGQVIGVDLADEMLALARANAKKGKYANVAFVKGDIEQLPLANDSADHIISNCVINLSLNKAQVYREAYRVLKPGGKLAISDIVLERELPDFVKSSLAGHIACVSGAETLTDYIQYVKDAGFKAVAITGKTDFPLELMLNDPQVMQVAKEMNFSLDGEEAKDIASRVSSISLTASK